QAFCAHYGTVILPTKPYTTRHKGKVEKGVYYVQDNALKGLTLHQPQGREPLSGLAQSLDVRLQEAAGKGLNHLEFLELRA
ncbi:MAG: hypothetical protein V3W34_11715, partial [Phycisphaerae bacterium]